MGIPLILFAAAFVARALGGIVHGDPAYPDSFYYANVADQLAAGHGFTVDYIWNFVDVGGRLPLSAHLPIPSNAHWMPLAALIQVPFIWAFGSTTLGHDLPFWIAAAATAPLTYAIARDAGLRRGLAAGAGALVVVPGGLAPFLSQPDNFSLFMPLGALALWACARGLRGDRRAFVLGGVAVGLATLSRNDGVLLGVPFALAFAVERWRAWRGVAARPLIGWGPALACAAAFVIVVAPWYARQLSVFGSLSPSAANGRILWIASYPQLFSITGETTPATFLAQGAGVIIGSRISGLVEAVKIMAVIPLMAVLVPFVVAGAWLRRRDPTFVPWIVYAAALFTFSALLFAVHVPYGTFLHSAVALVPHAYVAAVTGIAGVVAWIARRRPHWDVPRAALTFTAVAVVVAALLAVEAELRIGVATWGGEDRMRAPIVLALAAAPPGDVVMSPDPGAYRFLARRGGVVTPNDPLPVVEQTLRAYGVRWLVLEDDTVLPSLAPVLALNERPAWLSRPVVSVAPLSGAPRPAGIGAGSPRAALFAVCLEPADTRCAG